MRQASLIAWVSIFALFLGGCQGGNDGGETAGNTGTQTPVASPPFRIRPKPSPSVTPFGSKPLVAQKPGNTTGAVGLIPPVPPETAVKRVDAGRSDPFTAVPVQPEVTVSPNPVAPGAGAGAGTPNTRPVPAIPPVPPPVQPNRSVPRTRPQAPRTQAPRTQAPRAQAPRAQAPRSAPRSRARSNVLPPLRRLPNRQRIAARPNPKPTQPIRPPAGVASLPKPAPISPPLPGGPVATAPRLIPQLPKLPEPTQARGIQVTGVVQVGGLPMAIIQVPNEPARYVREGQRIANGEVLVKRIEVNSGPNPVVILEQYGIEVAREVGESPTGTPGQPQVPTASLPAPPINTNVSPRA